MKIFWSFCLLLGAAFIWNISAPLQGTHTIRQSDTLFAAYSYCIEGSDFLRPKIAHRGLSEGVAIGEFPLYSYLVSLPCQIRGSWSELDAKLFIVFFWILSALLWFQFAKVYFRNKTPSGLKPEYLFLILFCFSTQGLLYLTISLPDNLALTLIALSLLLFHHPKFSIKGAKVLAVLIFALAFAIRPYFIPLALLLSKDLRILLSLTVLCAGIYQLWYKHWVNISDVAYYYTAVPPLLESLKSLPAFFGKLVNIILRDWFHYIFILLVFFPKRKLSFLAAKPAVLLEVLGVLSSIFLLILVRGEHIIIHSYYLWPAAIFAFLLLTRSFLHIKNTKLQAGLLILYGLIGFVQTQHHFHRQAEYQAQKVQKLFSQYEISPQARIAVYVGDGSCSTQYLYWSRHQGWCFYEDQFKGAEFCPEGADYYFRFENEEPTLGPCIFSPTPEPNDK